MRIARRTVLAGVLVSGPALGQAAPVRVLSGGALEPAVAAALALWRREQGRPVEVTFNTAPRIAERLAANESWDIVLAPRPALAALEQPGRVQGALLPLGAVGVGIAVRDGAALPAITDAASFRAELLAADAAVFNRASTGLYIDRLLARLELTDAVTPKAVRFPDGDAVLRRIAAGQGREIAFAAVTEILLFREKGVRFVGELPGELGNRTEYLGALSAAAGQDAVRFFGFLTTPPARAAMAEAGVR